MPTKPRLSAVTNVDARVLNAIRNDATTNYRDYIPVATDSAESLRSIGTIMMDFPALRNEFIDCLVNRIAMTLVTSRVWKSPWAFMKKGTLDLGETVEEVYIDIAKAHTYDPSIAESEFMKRELPDAKSAFHVMNFKKFYKITIQPQSLRAAFLSWDALTEFTNTKLVEQISTAMEYDEYITIKYMFAKAILDGRIKAVPIPAVEKANLEDIVSVIKGKSNDFEFLKTAYNPAGVHAFAKKDEQYLIMDTDFNAKVDVSVLASAFNMSKADFYGHQILVDGWGEQDTERLNMLYKDDPSYEEIGSDDLAKLAKIPAVLFSELLLMIFDNMEEADENRNAQGLYRNYFRHTWKTFSFSPFANAVVFVPGNPAVTKVTVTPSTSTLPIGGQINLSVNVETDNFAEKSVNWTSDNENVTVDASGHVVVRSGATGTAIVNATSVFDPTKSGKCVITIG